MKLLSSLLRIFPRRPVVVNHYRKNTVSADEQKKRVDAKSAEIARGLGWPWPLDRNGRA